MGRAQIGDVLFTIATAAPSNLKEPRLPLRQVQYSIEACLIDVGAAGHLAPKPCPDLGEVCSGVVLQSIRYGGFRPRHLDTPWRRSGFRSRRSGYSLA